jgi:DNA-binding transcriptional LysR family regulator
VDLRQVRYFIEVAEQLHFCRAARKLKISQPTLSQQIRALEKRVGAELFLRKPKGIVLSPAGTAFLHKARLAVSEADGAIQDALDAKNGVTGRLRILCGPLAEYAVLKDVLRLMRQSSPGLAVEVNFPSNANHLGSISDGTFHASFMTCHFPASNSRLVCETLYREDCVVMVPESHPLARSRSLTLQQLASETWIITELSESLMKGDQLSSACGAAGFEPQLLHAADARALVPMVESGVGISLVPAALQSMHRPELRFVPLAAELQIPVNMIVRARHDSPHVRQFCEHAAQAVAMRASTAFQKVAAVLATRRITPRHRTSSTGISRRASVRMPSKIIPVAKPHSRESATLALQGAG